MQMDYKPGMTWKELRGFLSWQYNHTIDEMELELGSEKYHRVIDTMHKAISESAAPAMTKFYHHAALYAFHATTFFDRLGFAFMDAICND